MAIQYVPILKAKEGEFGALQEFEPSLRERIMPLFEVPQVPYDFINEKLSKSVAEHVSGIGTRLVRCWGRRPLMIDCPFTLDEDDDGSQPDAMAGVVASCLEAGVTLIPVITLDASPSRVSAALTAHGQVRAGVCVRVVVADADDIEDIPQRLDAVVGGLAGISPHDVDVMIDLQDISGDVSINVLVAKTLISEIDAIRWRRVFLAAASFPEDLSGVQRASSKALPRSEWELWQRVSSRNRGSNLVFADYGISNPVQKTLDPRTMQMSASIRYTTDDGWLVVKGRNVRQFGFDQYFQLSAELAANSAYKGKKYSWGDFYIWECAHKINGPGNATTWRKVGTNHHLTLVTHQLTTPADGA